MSIFYHIFSIYISILLAFQKNRIKFAMIGMDFVMITQRIMSFNTVAHFDDFNRKVCGYVTKF